jgi:DNA-binding CsgD family transcriptional regulator/tetratricopeptide (TPR) repeat protein
MLETLREFGQEQLRALDEEAAVRAAHAAHVLAVVEAGQARFLGHGQADWMDELDTEQGNLRAALDWALRSGDSETALRICAALWRYWTTRGGSEEGRNSVDRSLEAGENAPASTRLGGLIAAAFLAENHSVYETAWTRFEQAAALAESTGDRLALAQALDGMGTVASNRGDFEVATDRHERAAEVARELGNERMVAVATANLGSIAYRQADFDRAEQCWMECRAVLRKRGDLQGESLMTGNLGALAVMRGDLEQAEALLSEALAIHRQVRDVRSIASCLVNLGDIRLLSNDIGSAANCFDEAFALYSEIGDARGAAHTQIRIAKVAHALGDIASSRSTFTESLQVLVDVGDRFGLMESAEELAVLLVRDGDARTATKLYGLIDALRDELGSPRREPEQPGFEASMANLRTALGAATFDEAMAAGARLTPTEFVTMVAALPRPLTPVSAPTREKPLVQIEPDRQRLSDRELDVLRLVAAGCSNREIADALFISPRTASTHVEHILSKLSANSRSAAVAVAMREGFV